MSNIVKYNDNVILAAQVKVMLGAIIKRKLIQYEIEV